jgi:hypothetical protein
LGQLVDILALVNDDPDHARAICTEALRADPDDAQCLFIMALLFARAERFGEAIPLLEKVTRLKPSKAGAWNNLGMCYQECGRLKQAQAAFKKAIDLAPSPDYYANLGAAYNAECNYPEGKRWCKKALDIEPHHATAQATMGFCDLAQGNWADGWKGYDYSLGGRFRKEVKLGNEPRWDGEYVENLFVYGEQGIGDEIMYASCFGRSEREGGPCHSGMRCAACRGCFAVFPGRCEVHGTRRAAPAWAAERRFDAGVRFGEQLPRFFRPSSGGVPESPYLVADADRRVQWRSTCSTHGASPSSASPGAAGEPTPSAKSAQ